MVISTHTTDITGTRITATEITDTTPDTTADTVVSTEAVDITDRTGAYRGLFARCGERLP